MANKSYAIEWLEKAYHDLDSANVLLVAGHYTDTIGYLYHQSIEKIYKSVIAYNNEAIVKTHNLVELNELVNEYFELNEDDIMTLGIVTIYYTKQRYPSLDKKFPTIEDIKRVKELSEYLLEEVLEKLNIKISEIKNIQ